MLPFVVYSSVAVKMWSSPIWFVSLGGSSDSRTSIQSFVAVSSALALALAAVPLHDAFTLVEPTVLEVRVTCASPFPSVVPVALLRLPTPPVMAKSIVSPTSGDHVLPFVVYSSVAVKMWSSPIWFVAVDGVRFSRTSTTVVVASSQLLPETGSV